MKFNKVRVGRKYVFHPVMLDAFDPPYNVKDGDVVVVVNLPGCPRAGTMGHCHVLQLNGKFGGLVCVNSLHAVGSDWDAPDYSEFFEGGAL